MDVGEESFVDPSAPVKRQGGFCTAVDGMEQRIIVLQRQGALHELQLASDLDIMSWLEAVGEIPLTPYLER